IDPKGIRNLSWTNEPKLDFATTLRDIENRIGDAAVSLDSYIVSVTPAAEMRLHWGVTDAQLAQRHIVFDEDEDYVRRILAGP
ncbi:MAG: hypothetical protein U1F22_09480, partial [Lysobacterales bacterium]